MNDTKLFFLHIPRTGGTFIGGCLEQTLGDYGINTGHTVSRITPAHLYDLTPQNLVNTRVITGHLGNEARGILGDQWKCATLLRDPVERVQSEYYFMVKNEGLKDTIEEYVRGDYAAVDNLQVRFLTNYQDREMEPIRRPIGFADLVSAKMNLDTVDVVGVTSMMGVFLTGLAKLLDVDASNWHGSSNTIAKKPLTPSLIEEIRHRNQYDVELWKYACGLAFKRFSGEE